MEESSNVDDSFGEEVSASETAGTQGEVSTPNLGNSYSYFNSVFNMKFEIDKFDGSGDFGI